MLEAEDVESEVTLSVSVDEDSIVLVPIVSVEE